VIHPARELVDRAIFQAGVDALRVREKAHNRDEDAIEVVRRRLLPIVKVDGDSPLICDNRLVTLLDAFKGRRTVVAYYLPVVRWPAAARVMRGLYLLHDAVAGALASRRVMRFVRGTVRLLTWGRVRGGISIACIVYPRE